MLRRCLSYLLITLIALQSVVAIADSGQFQGAETEHQQFDSPQQSDTSADTQQRTPESKDSTTDHDVNDCHHCGQCHAGSHGFFAVTSNGLAFNPAKYSPSTLDIRYQTRTLSPALRPPIA